MSFEKIVGHNRIINFLKISIKNNKLAHAYIFEGRSGIGKGLTALEFVKAIVCKENIDDGCDNCPSCIKINTENHPDINTIEPNGNNIKNKQIEEFQNDILIKPYESDKKIFIIKAADTMTTSAQNRLLKVLEEPPSYGIIILITENSYGLLPTIRSRCQKIKFNRIPGELIQKYLLNKYDMSTKEAQILTTFSDGSLERAVDLYESQEFKDRRMTIIDITDSILKGDKLKLIDSVTFFEDNKEHIEELLDLLIIWFRDMLLLKETNEENKLFNIDYIDKLKAQLKLIEEIQILNIINIIEETRKNINSNVNYGLCIETMLLNIQEV